MISRAVPARSTRRPRRLSADIFVDAIARVTVLTLPVVEPFSDNN